MSQKRVSSSYRLSCCYCPLNFGEAKGDPPTSWVIKAVIWGPVVKTWLPLIGGIGVSGSTVENDHQVASAGLNAVMG